MTDREKLCDLLTDVLGMSIGYKADHLIDNGVTVRRWIPVTERLPTAEDAVDGHVYAFLKGHKVGGEWPWESVKMRPDWFTHWTHLPEPPKEVG